MLDSREFQALLAWLRVPYVGDRTLMALHGYAREVQLSLADLWELPAEDLGRLVRLDRRAMAALKGTAAEIWEQAGEEARLVAQRAIEPLVPALPAYPDRLRRASRPWPVLFAYGAVEVLEEPLVALLSSQDAGEEALALTDAIADELARRDVALVSGVNRPAYRAAAVAAKRQAGAEALVCDRGLLVGGPIEREPVPAARIWSDELDPEVQVVVSPFAPRLAPAGRGQARFAQRRDALVCDLASVAIAVEIRPGGTMDREARRARRRGARVLAIDRGERTPPGTRALWEEGFAEPVPPEAVAAAVADLLPAGEGSAERARRGWHVEVCRLVAMLAVVASGGRRTRELLVAPRRGALVEAMLPTPLGALATARPPTGAVDGACLDLLGTLPPREAGSRLLEAVRRVRAGGWIVAALPAFWLVADEHADWRRDLLDLGAPALIVHLPEPTLGPRRDPSAVLLFVRGAGVPESLPILTPERPQLPRHALRRYLAQALPAARDHLATDAAAS